MERLTATSSGRRATSGELDERAATMSKRAQVDAAAFVSAAIERAKEAPPRLFAPSSRRATLSSAVVCSPARRRHSSTRAMTSARRADELATIIVATRTVTRRRRRHRPTSTLHYVTRGVCAACGRRATSVDTMSTTNCSLAGCWPLSAHRRRTAQTSCLTIASLVDVSR